VVSASEDPAAAANPPDPLLPGFRRRFVVSLVWCVVLGGPAALVVSALLLLAIQPLSPVLDQPEPIFAAALLDISLAAICLRILDLGAARRLPGARRPRSALEDPM
jgi:hypothetical protein